MKPKILNNILPKETNRQILYHLSNHQWSIAWDNNKDRLKKISSTKNSGFSILTMIDEKIQFDTVLNIYGELIFNIIKEKLKIKATLYRVFWNMYLKGSETELHKDILYSNYRSIVYNLHRTDGGIEINSKFYEDIEGQAKIFKSDTVHRGIGPVQDNVRFSLNLIFYI
jgi:hypothetical protein